MALDDDFHFGRFVGIAIPICFLAFLAYQLVQEAGQVVA